MRQLKPVTGRDKICLNILPTRIFFYNKTSRCEQLLFLRYKTSKDTFSVLYVLTCFNLLSDWNRALNTSKFKGYMYIILITVMRTLSCFMLFLLFSVLKLVVYLLIDFFICFAFTFITVEIWFTWISSVCTVLANSCCKTSICFFNSKILKRNN